jgi:hypothetical protein
MNLAENRNDNDELENDEETAVSSSFSEDKEAHGKCKSCKNCPVCCFTVLHKYNFYGKAYTHLYNAYKLLLTLSSTQVACERSFSKLKYIKNRLRSSMSSTHLEAFMLMSVEVDVMVGLSNEDIIDSVAEIAPGLKTHLVL